MGPRTWGIFGHMVPPPGWPGARDKSNRALSVSPVDETATLSAGADHGKYASLHPGFAAGIARLESRGSGDYAAKNATSGALGRYQLLRTGLRTAGMIDADGRWLGKHGVRSESEFLANHEAQDKAYDDYLARMEGYTDAAGNLAHVGRTIAERRYDGQPMTITKAGVMGATHAVGQEWVANFLRWVEGNGGTTKGKAFPAEVWLKQPGDKWRLETDPAKIGDRFTQAERYMRELEGVEY